MSLSKVNSWLTLTANIGVLLGIFFLASEIQQSNRIGKNETDIEITNMFAEINRISMQFSGLIVKLSEVDPELTAAESYEAQALSNQYMNAWAAITSAFENGLISERQYVTRMANVGRRSRTGVPGATMCLFMKRVIRR